MIQKNQGASGREPDQTQRHTTVKFAAILVDNIIFVGKRHHNILQALSECGYIPAELQKCPQGFVDNNGMFLTRIEAAQIALENGQITKLKFHKQELFSEDLY